MHIIGYEKNGEYNLRAVGTYGYFSGTAWRTATEIFMWIYGNDDFPESVDAEFGVKVLCKLAGKRGEINRIDMEVRDIEAFGDAIMKNRYDVAERIADNIVEKSNLLVRKEDIKRRIEPEIRKRLSTYKRMLREEYE